MAILAHDVIAGYRIRYEPIRLSRVRTAATIDQIIQGVNPAVVDRASSVKLLRQERRGAKEVWYTATSGKHEYTVIIQATGDATRMDRADVLVSCSCPFWRWGGCEHHAKRDHYMYSESLPIGDLSKPLIRDPQNHNFVCKHIYAALQRARKIYVDMGPDKYRGG